MFDDDEARRLLGGNAEHAAMSAKDLAHVLGTFRKELFVQGFQLDEVTALCHEFLVAIGRHGRRTGRRMTTSLGSDGWEHCQLYHWMIGQAAQGVATTIMPDVKHDGYPVAFCLPVSPFNQILIADRQLRAYAHVGFAVGAHELASQART